MHIYTLCFTNLWIINGGKLPCDYDFQSSICSVLFIDTNCFFLFVVYDVYTYTCRCKEKHNEDFNEQTNALLYKNIPFTLYSWKGCKRVDVGYVWEVSWKRRQTATYWPKVPLTIALLPHSAGLLNCGSWGPKPSVWSWFSLRGHPISDCNYNSNSNCNWTGTPCLKLTDSSRLWHLVI